LRCVLRCVLRRVLGEGGEGKEAQEERGQREALHCALAATTSVPVILLWPEPQYSEHLKPKVPALLGTNSTVTGAPPLGIAVFTPSSGMAKPCLVSAEWMVKRTWSPSLTSIRSGWNSKREAVTSIVFTEASVVSARSGTLMAGSIKSAAMGGVRN